MLGVGVAVTIEVEVVGTRGAEVVDMVLIDGIEVGKTIMKVVVLVDMARLLHLRLRTVVLLAIIHLCRILMAQFLDPYLNIDAGTMSPFEHGEVFVLDDGGEVCICLYLVFMCGLGFIINLMVKLH